MTYKAISHTRYVLVNRLAMPLGSFLILIIIGRHSDLLLGGYALSMTFYFIMQMLPLLGLTSYVMREVARAPERANDYFNTIGSMSIVGCILVDIIVFSFLPYAGYSAELTEAIQIVGILIFPGILVFIAEIIFTSLHDAKPVAVIALVENLSRVLLSIAVLIIDAELAALIWVFVITRSGACLAYVLLMLRKGYLKNLGAVNLDLLRRTIHVLPSFLIGAILFIVLSRMDFLVLSIYEKVESIGHYAVSFRLYDLGALLLSGVVMALFPWVSKQFLGARQHYRTAITSIITLFAIALGLTSFLGILFAEYYVQILFAKQYPEPVLLAQLFMVALFIGGMDFVASGILHASDQQTRDVKANAIGGFFGVALLFGLIPVFGIYGAFLAKLFATLLQGLIKYSMICRLLQINWKNRKVLLTILYTTGLISLTYPVIDEHILVRVAIAAVVTPLFPLLLVASGLVSPIRLLRYYLRPGNAQDTSGFAGMLNLIVADSRRRERILRQANYSHHRTQGAIDKGLLGALIYRFSQWASNQSYRRLAKLLNVTNRVLTNVNISYQSKIGPGLVILSPQAVNFSGNAGDNLTCIGQCAVALDVNLPDNAYLE